MPVPFRLLRPHVLPFPQALPFFTILPSLTLRPRSALSAPPLFVTMPNQVPAAIKYFAEKQQQGKFTFQAGRYVHCPLGPRSRASSRRCCGGARFVLVRTWFVCVSARLAGTSPLWVPRSQSTAISGEGAHGDHWETMLRGVLFLVFGGEGGTLLDVGHLGFWSSCVYSSSL